MILEEWIGEGKGNSGDYMLNFLNTRHSTPLTDSRCLMLKCSGDKTAISMLPLEEGSLIYLGSWLIWWYAYVRRKLWSQISMRKKNQAVSFQRSLAYISNTGEVTHLSEIFLQKAYTIFPLKKETEKKKKICSIWITLWYIKKQPQWLT